MNTLEKQEFASKLLQETKQSFDFGDLIEFAVKHKFVSDKYAAESGLDFWLIWLISQHMHLNPGYPLVMLSGPVDAMAKASFAFHYVQHRILMSRTTGTQLFTMPISASMQQLPQARQAIRQTLRHISECFGRETGYQFYIWNSHPKPEQYLTEFSVTSAVLQQKTTDWDAYWQNHFSTPSSPVEQFTELSLD